MNTRSFPDHIRDLIARNDLPAALQQLRDLLEHSPLLDEAILQSARFQDIRKQIRLGMVSDQEANMTQSQIRAGLLELVREMEAQGSQVPEIQREIERSITVTNSKNVIIGSSISAGGNIILGDNNTLKS